MISFTSVCSWETTMNTILRNASYQKCLHARQLAEMSPCSRAHNLALDMYIPLIIAMFLILKMGPTRVFNKLSTLLSGSKTIAFSIYCMYIQSHSTLTMTDSYD